MPSSRNFDFYVSRQVSDNFQSALETVFGDMGLVLCETSWPPTYVLESETTMAMFNGDERICLSSEVSECRVCGQATHRDSEHSANVEGLVGARTCSSDCLHTYAEEQGLFRVVYGSHGSNVTYYNLGNAEGMLAPYSALNQNGFETTDSDRFLVGMEVEKEDSCHHDDCGSTNVLAEAADHGWIAVSDGSLHCDNGFELVSPAYNLTASEGNYGRAALERTLDSFSALNADTSHRCGGHITVSCEGLTGPQLAARLEPIFPILYALYPNRIGNEYSPMVRGSQATDVGYKMRAVNTLSNRVEFRLFSGVKTSGQLKDRIDLLRQALICLVGNDGSLLTEAEARSELDGAIDNKHSALWSAIFNLTNDVDGSDRSEMRDERIRGFRKWYATGAIMSSISDFIR